jgi:hypothetical protein
LFSPEDDSISCINDQLVRLAKVQLGFPSTRIVQLTRCSGAATLAQTRVARPSFDRRLAQKAPWMNFESCSRRTAKTRVCANRAQTAFCRSRAPSFNFAATQHRNLLRSPSLSGELRVTPRMEAPLLVKHIHRTTTVHPQ